RGVEGARGGERADVELVDERTVHLDALPPGVGPGVGVRVEGARGPVDAVRLVGAARVRVGALAVDQEGVVGAGGQPGRVLPPPVRGGGHRCAVVADDEGDVGRVRRPDLDGDGAHLKTVPRCHASDRPGSRGRTASASAGAAPAPTAGRAAISYDRAALVPCTVRDGYGATSSPRGQDGVGRTGASPVRRHGAGPPAGRAAISYDRAALVPCTVRARHGATSSLRRAARHPGGRGDPVGSCWAPRSDQPLATVARMSFAEYRPGRARDPLPVVVRAAL